MITAILNEVIGPWGRAVLNYYFANQSVINSIFLIWAGIMTYASLKLTAIRHLTVKMSVEALKNNPKASDEEIWKAFRPNWQAEVEKLNARFILNRWNIWVTRPTPEKLVEILRLGPAWFTAIRNGEVLRYRFSVPGKNDRLSSF
jgi:hypothetical protein